MVAIVYLGLMPASLTKQHFVVELVLLIFKKKPAVIKACNIIVTILLDGFAIFMANYLLVPVGIVFMAVFYTYRIYLDLTQPKEAQR